MNEPDAEVRKRELARLRQQASRERRAAADEASVSIWLTAKARRALDRLTASDGRTATEWLNELVLMRADELPKTRKGKPAA